MRYLQLALCGALLSAAFAGCRKEAFDDFYSRPDYLESPIYTRLTEVGQFSLFRQLIEKAGYAETLGQAGSWTLFAPNDEAVTRFIDEPGSGYVDPVTDDIPEQIVRFHLVYNAFKTNT